MVHINQVELTHFKSFGGSIQIPLEPGFTVVTGPNGSGKSNILDAVLFCLGLASSRGMRAERLPDLINSAVLRDGRAAEASVTVRFDLGDWQPDEAEEGLEPPEGVPWIQPGQREWSVTRRLRVAPGGTYSSAYSADGVACNLQQLQTQLRRLRVDPDGSNVVMQGDVTRIVSMSARDRRGIIDELAGVALFDSRIEQSRAKLDEVQERQERCHIVEQELLVARQKLEKDCARARTYQELRQRLHSGREQERVLAYEAARDQQQALVQRDKTLEQRSAEAGVAIAAEEEQERDAATALEGLQAEVRALGEDRLVALQGELAGLEAGEREHARQGERHRQRAEELQGRRQELVDRQRLLRDEARALEAADDADALAEAEERCRSAEAAVELSRRRLGEVAGRSGSWMEEQKQRSETRQALQQQLGPLEAEREQRQERLRLAEERLAELQADAGDEDRDDAEARLRLEALERELPPLEQELSREQERIGRLDEELALQQRTRTRLEQEQASHEREIARLDSRRETLQESRGTGALRLLLESGLEGIHGPVAQLGEVEERHRLALEVAAGARLGQVVVEHDGIAARAIELLKSRRAGRLTFLPLNRIRGGGGGSSAGAALQRGGGPGGSGGGLVGRAVELVRHEPVYGEVFRYVFGDTLVFRDLESARRELGRCRAVTLEGELLEKSGAMTGGSLQTRSGQLSFGRSAEGDEAEPLRRRLLDVGESLVACRRREGELARQLAEARPALEQCRQRRAALAAETEAARRLLQPLRQRSAQRQERRQQLEAGRQADGERLAALEREIAPLRQQLEGLLAAEAEAGADADAARWQGLQADLEAADRSLSEARQERDGRLAARRERALAQERVTSQLSALAEEEGRLAGEVGALVQEREQWKTQQQLHATRRQELEGQMAELQSRFGEQRRRRDAAEAALAALRQRLQQHRWELERLREERQALAEERRSHELRLEQLQRELPDPAPTIPEEVREAGLEALQEELRRLQQRMEALEPVNMLALEELEQLEQRLAGLEEKLEVLAKEREELLLRIETVGTLRQEAFLEAFRAVDGHFRTIFADLSDGEGHLQLENPEDPLEGGLTLVAHPRGKAVRRLASMSGGEKSLTALSFLFALQRFRPSPFYALDEVDSFLDGVNVERLAGLIAAQSGNAQFLVVSHRRPMIGAATRTIGVTQARGAHTQVVGLPPAA
ncbi:MAG: chromosome segregation protein SMC [Cyanobacteriota bacterium]|nr:chromosome segregation protein SMC [Cyanobacteriota bacterium]